MCIVIVGIKIDIIIELWMVYLAPYFLVCNKVMEHILDIINLCIIEGEMTTLRIMNASPRTSIDIVGGGHLHYAQWSHLSFEDAQINDVYFVFDYRTANKETKCQVSHQ